MDRFTADYFDGRSSLRRRVEVTVAGDRAVIVGPEVELEHAVADLVVQPRVGSTPFRIVLPGGGALVTHDEIGRVLHVPRPAGLAHRLESNLRVVLASFAGLIVVGTLGYLHGIPWFAREVAYRLPPELESEIATQGMKELDKYLLKPTTLTKDRQNALRAMFEDLRAASTIPARIEFRDGAYVGANAFALPGGVVVMTDQLEHLLKQDDGRIAAVLAHEIGHLEYRHGARHILQDSIAALLATALLGDASGISGLLATLPALLTHTANSRDFEREADTFAYGLLRGTGRSPRLLGEALAALEKAQEDELAALGGGCKVALDDPPKGETASANVPASAEGNKAPPAEKRRSSAVDLRYLSTHPPTEERIRAAEEAAK
jgi:Zn-dependent protease with chaperone function